MGEKNNTAFKNVGWSAVSIIIAILTIYTVIEQTKVFSLKTMFSLIVHGEPIFIVCACACMILFICAEGEALRMILSRITGKASRRQGFIYAAADIYFSAITPSASGGQPASLVFMMRDGFPGPQSMICLIYNLLMYNASIVLIAFLSITIRWDLFWSFEGPAQVLVVIGIVALVALMIGFYMLLRKSDWLLKIGIALINLLSALKVFHKKEKWNARLEGIIAKYSSIATYLAGDWELALKIFLLNLFQRGIQISISVCVYLGLGGHISRISDVWFTQAYATVGSNCIPIPGAMGVIDYLLCHGFQNIMSDTMAVHTEMLSRGVSFYICISISFVTIVCAYFMKRKNN